MGSPPELAAARAWTDGWIDSSPHLSSRNEGCWWYRRRSQRSTTRSGALEELWKVNSFRENFMRLGHLKTVVPRAASPRTRQSFREHVSSHQLWHAHSSVKTARLCSRSAVQPEKVASRDCCVAARRCQSTAKTATKELDPHLSFFVRVVHRHAAPSESSAKKIHSVEESPFRIHHRVTRKLLQILPAEKQ